MAQSHETAQSSILSKTEEQKITEQTINRNFNSRKWWRHSPMKIYIKKIIILNLFCAEHFDWSLLYKRERYSVFSLHDSRLDRRLKMVPPLISIRIIQFISASNKQMIIWLYFQSRIPVYIGQHPAGTSSQNMIHYIQVRLYPTLIFAHINFQ